MKLSIQFFISCIAITCVSLTCKCSPPTAGGTTDTGNAKIAAMIFTEAGQRAAGIKVVISPAGYIPSTGADSNTIRTQQIREAITDDSGYFNILSIDTGDYFIEINDGDSSAVLLQVTVSSSDKSSILLIDTLKPYSAIEGNAGSTLDPTSKRFLFIYGLDRRIPVASDGTFIISDLPEGVFQLRIGSENNTWIPVDLDSVVTVSSQTVYIPFAGWRYRTDLMLNTTASGADVGENVYNIPILVRLSDNNFDFSKARGDGSDCRFIKNDNKYLPFEVEQWDSIKGKASIWVLIDTLYGNNDLQYFTLIYGNPNAESLESSYKVFDTLHGSLGNYHFNGNLKDATYNKFDGIDSGTSDSPEGIIGRARGFNGSSSFFSIGDIPDRPSGTISFWFKPKKTFDSTSAQTQGIWGKKTSDSIDYSIILRGKDYYTDLSSSSGLTGIFMSKLEDGDSGYYLESSLNCFVAGIWYYAVWCWGSSGNYLYINGVLQDFSTDVLPVTGEADDEIGRCLNDASNIAYGAARYYYGLLDEFRIENTSRDENWVRLCYMNQREEDKLVRIGSR